MTDRWSPPPPPLTLGRTAKAANLVLRDVIHKATGVDGNTLANLVALKNALVEDFLTRNGGEDRPTREFIEELNRELEATAENQNHALKVQEAEAARRRKFGYMDGVKVVEDMPATEEAA